MDQVEKHDPLPPAVAEALKEVAQRHLYAPVNDHVNSRQFVDLARHRYHEVIGHPSSGDRLVLQAECVHYLRLHQIPHGNQSCLSAVGQIDNDLTDHLTGIKEELIQQHSINYDLAQQA